ncbi:unnamed protein product [Orchesella dallaii]|uniref:Uncharacterized protein n=1 Tax=Orchesella dallaii TaxID=48710 RepID=A0ABP1PM32_9HEXA
MPPKCYKAGLQGPCQTHQVLLQIQTTSNHGICVNTSSNVFDYTTGYELKTQQQSKSVICATRNPDAVIDEVEETTLIKLTKRKRRVPVTHGNQRETYNKNFSNDISRNSFLVIAIYLPSPAATSTASTYGGNSWNISTENCPPSSQVGDSVWLLYGMPPKCYETGLQGPCKSHQIFQRINSHSNYGVCMLRSSTVSHPQKLLNEEEKKLREMQYLREELSSCRRQLRMKISEGEIDSPDGSQGGGYVWIRRNRCPNGQFFSRISKKCIERNLGTISF